MFLSALTVVSWPITSEKLLGLYLFANAINLNYWSRFYYFIVESSGTKILKSFLFFTLRQFDLNFLLTLCTTQPSRIHRYKLNNPALCPSVEYISI